MKKLTIPKPKLGFTDADWMKTDLLALCNRNKRKKFKLTLYGAYKRIRGMSTFAALGDYVILSQCISFFRDREIPFTKLQVRNCLKYFEDYKPKHYSFDKKLVDLLLIQDDGVN